MIYEEGAVSLAQVTASANPTDKVIRSKLLPVELAVNKGKFQINLGLLFSFLKKKKKKYYIRRCTEVRFES